MKKIIAFFMAAIMLLSLTACNSKSEAGNNDGPVQIDEGLLTMEITINASFFEDQTEEEIKAAAKEEGFLDCTVNENGSVTYKMTRNQHKAKLKEFKETLEKNIAGILEGDDKVASFISIDYNDDFSKIDIFVDPEAYSSWDNLYVLSFFISGAYYQSFAGVDGDKIDIVVNFIDNNTKEVLDSASYKEFRENLEESQNSATAETNP